MFRTLYYKNNFHVKIKILLTLTGYQITWIACVFGEKYFPYLSAGIIVGTIYLFLFLTFTNNQKRSVKIIMFIAIPGYLFDSLLVLSSTYNFECIWKLGVLPIWLVILWLSFATLFVDVLVFFKRYSILGVLISSILGPFTYYLGQPIGIISINNYYLFFISMIFFWGLLMHYYLKYILQLYSTH